jgi:hypothetical protein
MIDYYHSEQPLLSYLFMPSNHLLILACALDTDVFGSLVKQTLPIFFQDQAI